MCCFSAPDAGGAAPPSSGLRADYQGDGYDDLASFYDLGSGSSSLVLWNGRAAGGFSAPTQVWQSTPGGWDTQRARPLAGDFNGDGRDDVAAFYDHGGATSSLRFWLSDTVGGFAAPVEVWHSATGGWNLASAKAIAADLTGDGKTDISAFYDLGNGASSLWLWSATSFASPTQRWQSVANGWNLSLAKPVAGDFDGDGDGEIAPSTISATRPPRSGSGRPTRPVRCPLPPCRGRPPRAAGTSRGHSRSSATSTAMAATTSDRSTTSAAPPRRSGRGRLRPAVRSRPAMYGNHWPVAGT